MKRANTDRTVAIVYGFAEGSWHGRKLRKSLRAAGFKITRDLKSAEYIIGHSAGCYLIPADTTARLILHIGYTYWPRRGLFDSLRHNLALERQKHGFIKWFIRCTINDLHMLKFIQTARMVRGWRRRAEHLENLPKTRHVFVRSQHDPYCEPESLMHHAGYEHTYISSPGNHNDLWDNPGYYTDLLQSLP